ncbi:fibronectin type III domain-containing protein [Sphingobacterium phlebotomi]|uniref:Fibronectin type III domain-containing protein n=1 Tax=Sphingobacterium phlebotomi TaxID=2605433 RepID=A0A5D4H422_9SPHI|nr:fibronectin type III domain-containing protein [Sphingobacterium phlebotomi]TYR35003.1 fibronectin type III domain-containing protein [Sphingobacterium phlebotomi]
MAKTTLKTGAAGNSEAAYVKFVENIVVKLTENAALFPAVEPERDTLEQALSEFKRAQADAAYRDRRLVVIKNQAYAALKAEVYRISLYVERQTEGDEAMILAAGFIPSKRGVHVLEPAPKPKIFLVKVNAHVSGIVELKVNSWRRVLAYQFEYRKKNSDSHWNNVISSKSKVTITGLEPVQEYEFRVAYIGRNPQITYSDIVSSYVF